MKDSCPNLKTKSELAKNKHQTICNAKLLFPKWWWFQYIHCHFLFLCHFSPPYWIKNHYILMSTGVTVSSYITKISLKIYKMIRMCVCMYENECWGEKRWKHVWYFTLHLAQSLIISTTYPFIVYTCSMIYEKTSIKHWRILFFDKTEQ